MKHADPNSLVITLPAERIDEAVQCGDYASKDEIVLDALKSSRLRVADGGHPIG